MSKYPDIAHRIHQLAKHLGVDQARLGMLAGVTKQAAGKWFSGESRPQHEALMRLKEKTGVSDEWIMRGKGEMLLKNTVSEPSGAYHVNGLTDEEISLLGYIQALSVEQKQALITLLRGLKPTPQNKQSPLPHINNA